MTRAPVPARGRRRSSATKERGLLQYIGLGLSAALLLLIAGIAVLVVALPAAVGGLPLTVLTSSMEPGLPPGTLVVMKPTPVEDVRIGDVLTYQITSGEPAVVSHRVTSKSTDTLGKTTFTTKGDNNDAADPLPVMEVQVKGTVWYSIPYLGWVNNAITGEARAWLVPLAAGALFAYFAYTVVASIVTARRTSRRRANAAARASSD